jgi:hypothetical protein
MKKFDLWIFERAQCQQESLRDILNFTPWGMFTPSFTPGVNTFYCLEEWRGKQNPQGITSPQGDKIHPKGPRRSRGPRAPQNSPQGDKIHPKGTKFTPRGQNSLLGDKFAPWGQLRSWGSKFAPRGEVKNGPLHNSSPYLQANEKMTHLLASFFNWRFIKLFRA